MALVPTPQGRTALLAVLHAVFRNQEPLRPHESGGLSAYHQVLLAVMRFHDAHVC